MVGELTPRRGRATYGGGPAKRRRIARPLQDSPGSQSDVGDSPSKVAITPLTRSSRHSQWPPRTPSPSRPSTPSPASPSSNLLSQDLVSAFELASPGSSQLPVVATFTQRDSLASPSLSSCPAQLETLFDTDNDAHPQPEKRAGLASRMNRAKRKDDGLATQSQRDSPRSGTPLAALDGDIRHTQSGHVHGTHSQPSGQSGTASPRARLDEFLSPRKMGARTYGSGVRSFLEEQGGDDANSGAAGAMPATVEQSTSGKDNSYTEADDADPLSAKRLQQRETYAELRSRWVIEDALGDDGPAQTADKSLRSLTNLRSAGSLKRFMDELDYSLTGLDPDDSLAVRRSAAISVLSQVCGSTGDVDDGAASSTFLQRLKAARAQGKVWRALRGAGAGNGQDVVLDLAIGIVVLHLAHKNAFSEDFFHTYAKDVCRCLSSMLESGPTAVPSKSRSEQASWARLGELFALACPLAVTGHPSVATVALCAVCALGSLQPGPSTEPIHLALVGDGCVWDKASRCVSDEIEELVHVEAEKADQRIKASRSGLPLLPREVGVGQPKAPCMDHLDLIMQCIEILDIHGTPTEAGDSRTLIAGEERLAKAISTLLQWISLVAGDSLSAANKGKAWTILCAALRTSIARAQRNREWARAYAARRGSIATLSRVILQVDVEKSEIKDHDTAHAPSNSTSRFLLTEAQRIDTICLALALLTILLETGQEAGHELASAQISGDARANTPAIRCLFDLCMTYARQSDDEGHNGDEASEDMANRHFVAGCLSVAIALAVQGHSACLSALRSDATDKDPVGLLTACLDDFSSLNDAVHERASLSGAQAAYCDGMDQMRSMAEGGSVVRRMADCMRALCRTDEG